MEKIKAFIASLGNNDLKKKTESESFSNPISSSTSEQFLISASDTTGFVDFEIEPYSYIERIAFAYHKVPIRFHYSSTNGQNINRLINILFTIYKIKHCDENVHAFIDAWFDKRHERRMQIAEDFWKSFKYDMSDVDRAIKAFKDYPLEGYHIFDHELDSLDHEIIVRINDILSFFHFDLNDEVINRVIKLWSNEGKNRKSISISKYRGVWVVKKCE